MILKMKWHARQVARAILYMGASVTALLVAVCIFYVLKFYDLGLDMYQGQGIKWSKSMNLKYELHAFWVLTLAPLVRLLPVALLADFVIRRRFLRLQE